MINIPRFENCVQPCPKDAIAASLPKERDPQSFGPFLPAYSAYFNNIHAESFQTFG